MNDIQDIHINITFIKLFNTKTFDLKIQLLIIYLNFN